MLKRPLFNPSFRVETVSNEGVFLLSERGQFLLRGGLNCLLAPLIDGSNTVDDIVDRLHGHAPAADVYYALEVMEKKGYAVEADAAGSPEQATFWHSLGVDPGLAERRLRDTRVRIAVFGELPRQPLESALGTLQVTVDDDRGDSAWSWPTITFTRVWRGSTPRRCRPVCPGCW
jgi:ribosomal protein S12 methylthiotransferase accessory factor